MPLQTQILLDASVFQKSEKHQHENLLFLLSSRKLLCSSLAPNYLSGRFYHSAKQVQRRKHEQIWEEKSDEEDIVIFSSDTPAPSLFEKFLILFSSTAIRFLPEISFDSVSYFSDSERIRLAGNVHKMREFESRNRGLASSSIAVSNNHNQNTKNSEVDDKINMILSPLNFFSWKDFFLIRHREYRNAKDEDENKTTLHNILSNEIHLTSIKVNFSKQVKRFDDEALNNNQEIHLFVSSLLKSFRFLRTLEVSIDCEEIINIFLRSVVVADDDNKKKRNNNNNNNLYLLSELTLDFKYSLHQGLDNPQLTTGVDEMIEPEIRRTKRHQLLKRFLETVFPSTSNIETLILKCPYEYVEYSAATVCVGETEKSSLINTLRTFTDTYYLLDFAINKHFVHLRNLFVETNLTITCLENKKNPCNHPFFVSIKKNHVKGEGDDNDDTLSSSVTLSDLVESISSQLTQLSIKNTSNWHGWRDVEVLLPPQQQRRLRRQTMDYRLFRTSPASIGGSTQFVLNSKDLSPFSRCLQNLELDIWSRIFSSNDDSFHQLFNLRNLKILEKTRVDLDLEKPDIMKELEKRRKSFIHVEKNVTTSTFSSFPCHRQRLLLLPPNLETLLLSVSYFSLVCRVPSLLNEFLFENESDNISKKKKRFEIEVDENGLPDDDIVQEWAKEMTTNIFSSNNNNDNNEQHLLDKENGSNSSNNSSCSLLLPSFRGGRDLNPWLKNLVEKISQGNKKNSNFCLLISLEIIFRASEIVVDPALLQNLPALRQKQKSKENELKHHDLSTIQTILPYLTELRLTDRLSFVTNNINSMESIDLVRHIFSSLLLGPDDDDDDDHEDDNNNNNNGQVTTTTITNNNKNDNNFVSCSSPSLLSSLKVWHITSTISEDNLGRGFVNPINLLRALRPLVKAFQKNFGEAEAASHWDKFVLKFSSRLNRRDKRLEKVAFDTVRKELMMMKIKNRQKTQ